MNQKMIKLVLIAKIREGLIKMNSLKSLKKGKGKGNQPPKNNNTNNKDIKIICEYSANENKAKDIAEYSTLKPETNSDSPSVKSKGVLFVSAKAETLNIIAAGNKGKIYQIFFWAKTISEMFKLPTHNNTEIIINPIDTSYDIIWAAALIAPKYAYFELLDHPDINTAYTLIEDTPNIYNIPILISDNTTSLE